MMLSLRNFKIAPKSIFSEDILFGWDNLHSQVFAKEQSLKTYSKQTGAEMKLIHSINIGVKINDVTFGEGNTVLITTEENRIVQVAIR